MVSAFEATLRDQIANHAGWHPVARVVLASLNHLPPEKHDAAWLMIEQHVRVHTRLGLQGEMDWAGAIDWPTVLLEVLRLILAVLPFVLAVI